jgi:hypothetical protein
MKGAGTLAPIDPPRSVVRGGAYRVVRNPMYVANVAITLGSGAVFAAWELVVWAAVVLVAFHLFVMIYEEPTLTRIFGEDYEDYRCDVGRWVPRRLGVVARCRDEPRGRRSRRVNLKRSLNRLLDARAQHGRERSFVQPQLVHAMRPARYEQSRCGVAGMSLR